VSWKSEAFDVHDFGLIEGLSVDLETLAALLDAELYAIRCDGVDRVGVTSRGGCAEYCEIVAVHNA
jgi:hypothetical protein